MVYEAQNAKHLINVIGVRHRDVVNYSPTVPGSIAIADLSQIGDKGRMGQATGTVPAPVNCYPGVQPLFNRYSPAHHTNQYPPMKLAGLPVNHGGLRLTSPINTSGVSQICFPKHEKANKFPRER
ncbi:hypothetical protein CBL_06634 [Carabus blaptoides fortunei]